MSSSRVLHSVHRANNSTGGRGLAAAGRRHRHSESRPPCCSLRWKPIRHPTRIPPPPIVTAPENHERTLRHRLRLAACDRRGGHELRAALPRPLARDHRLDRLESLFDPETIIIGGQMPPAILAAMVTSLGPLLPSVAHRRFRQRPRLTLGATGLWSAALGAAMQPISRTFDPQFGAILKAGAPQ